MVRARILPILALSLLALTGAAHAQLNVVNGNGNSQNGINSGFGGVLGGGFFNFAQSGGSVTLTFNRGAGNLNDAAVIYIATGGAGFNTTSGFTDTADPLRKAISGLDGSNRSTLNFASGFNANYAIAFDQGFAGLWQLTNGGSHNFVASLGLSPTGTTTSPTYTMGFSMTQLGLVQGDGFDYVATYLNANNAFRSNEFIGVAAYGGGNPGVPSTVNLAAGDFNRYNSLIPEPGALALLALSLPGALLLRRRK